jgi:hypothetical protein
MAAKPTPTTNNSRKTAIRRSRSYLWTTRNQDRADKADDNYVNQNLYALAAMLRALTALKVIDGGRGGAPEILDVFKEMAAKRSEGRVGNPRLPVTMQRSRLRPRRRRPVE